MTTFETGFAEAERASASAAKATATLLGTIKGLEKAARAGDIGALRKAADRLSAGLDAVRQEVANARSSWPFTEEEEERYLKDDYAQELSDRAAAEGLRLQMRDGQLLVFPSILRVLPAERGIKVDKKRVTAIRPSTLVSNLKANQAKKARSSSDKFLESLFRAYRLIAGEGGYGTTVALAEVYGALTILPGSAGEYSSADFARDLFLLDQSGLRTTKTGSPFSLPASTGTKSPKGTFTFLSPDGELLTFFGVRFTGAA